MATGTTEHLHAILDLSCAIKVVDVGANPIDGVAPYAPLLAAGHTSIVGFEPNLEALEELNQKKGPNETYLPNAVGDGKRHTLRICQAPGMTSILEPNPAVLNMFHGFPDWGRVLRTEKVDTVRLDDLPETEGMDYLKIDIQGGELMVFKNAVERLAHAVLIHTEAEFLQMYVGQPLFSDVELFLRKRGFVLHKFYSLTSRTIQPMLLDNNIYGGMSQVFWTDAIFVRNFIDPSSMNDDQLLRLAVILHDCYRSYDLEHFHFRLKHTRSS